MSSHVQVSVCRVVSAKRVVAKIVQGFSISSLDNQIIKHDFMVFFVVARFYVLLRPHGRSHISRHKSKTSDIVIHHVLEGLVFRLACVSLNDKIKWSATELKWD